MKEMYHIKEVLYFLKQSFYYHCQKIILCIHWYILHQTLSRPVLKRACILNFVDPQTGHKELQLQ